jgi:hypothetical protein
MRGTELATELDGKYGSFSARSFACRSRCVDAECRACNSPSATSSSSMRRANSPRAENSGETCQ